MWFQSLQVDPSAQTARSREYKETEYTGLCTVLCDIVSEAWEKPEDGVFGSGDRGGARQALGLARTTASPARSLGRVIPGPEPQLPPRGMRTAACPLWAQCRRQEKTDLWRRNLFTRWGVPDDVDPYSLPFWWPPDETRTGATLSGCCEAVSTRGQRVSEGQVTLIKSWVLPSRAHNCSRPASLKSSTMSWRATPNVRFQDKE